MAGKVIAVIGQESGGTSTAAGILHHLGVHMGRLTHEAAKKSTTLSKAFNTFECRDCIEAIRRPDAPTFEFDQFGYAMIEYINMRYKKAGSRRVGFKNVATCTLGMMQKEMLDALPLELFQIKRDLNKVFASVIKYHGSDYMPIIQVASGLLSTHQLLLKMEPTIALNYEDILARPRESVEMVRDAFKLKTTTRQFERAVRFVDPVGCAKNTINKDLRPAFTDESAD